MKEWFEEHGMTVAVAAAVGLVGFLAAGIFAKPAPPAIEIRTLEPQPSPTTTLFVHVEGAVNMPGVYRLPGDARIFEAIDAAGGATPDAEVRNLNLAARVADGQKLVVPMHGGASDPSGVGAGAASPAATAESVSGAPTGARININTATQRILESLPGIGPVTAQRIIQYRTANGPFTSVQQLRNAGVNASTFERIKDLVTI